MTGGALISVLGVREAVREAQIITARTFNYTSYVVATALFLAVSLPLVRLVDRYTRRDRERRSRCNERFCNAWCDGADISRTLLPNAKKCRDDAYDGSEQSDERTH